MRRAAGFLLCIAGAWAQEEVHVEARLSPPVIPFHRQAVFEITVDAPASAKIELPNMVGRFGGLNVYGTPEYRKEKFGKDRVRITEAYRLDAIQIGNYFIEPVRVSVGDAGVAVLPSPALTVRDLTEEERKAAMEFDAELAIPDFSERSIYARWEVWASAAGVLVIAGLVLAWWLRRRRAPAPVVAKRAWEVAYERLQSLDQKQWPQAGKFTPYYVDLSAIVRYYIEDRFHVHAPEQTTPEFLDEIRGKGILTAEHERLLANLLRHCDRVKFARYEPTVQEMEHSFAEVLRFVDETVPREEAAAEAAA